MKYKILLTVLSGIFLLSASHLHGQVLSGSIVVSPYVGTGLPVSDFADNDADNPDVLYRQPGVKFGLSAEYYLGLKVAMGINFMYASHTSREVQGFETGGRLETLMFGVQGKYLYQRFTRVKPYAVLGFGLVRNNMRNGRFRFDTDIGDYELDTRLYMNGGFGLQYQLRPSVSLFLEGGLDIMLTRDAQINMDGETLRDPETDRPLEIGSNYYFIDFKAGVNFRFGGED